MATLVLLEAKARSADAVEELKMLLKERLPETRAYDGCRGITFYLGDDGLVSPPRMARRFFVPRHQGRVAHDVGEHDGGEAAFAAVGHDLALREPDAAEQVLEAGVGAQWVQARVGLRGDQQRLALLVGALEPGHRLLRLTDHG